MNMSNNAMVTRDGGEIATAQAVQAKACGIEPTVDMNPVLLKTMSDSTCQAILLGKPFATVKAGELGRWRGELLQAIEGALDRLRKEYDVLVIEGAGSPAEINLKETDLANMVVARMAEAQVLLIGDIERGGVFAQLVGTLDLLEPQERNRVAGFLINKFRGELSLLAPGIEWLRKRTGKPTFGVVPFVPDLQIPEEDALGIPKTVSDTFGVRHLKIQVIQYPTISNFTDFDPFRQETELELEFLTRPPANGANPDFLILPGSKSTMADLSWLRRSGFDQYIARCVEKKVEVLGICGGFQMLGEMLYDPSHVESQESAMQGLGMLPVSTLFLPSKVTAQVEGVHLESGEKVRGYEIHTGRLQGARKGKPIFRITKRSDQMVNEQDGCRIPERKVWGTYLHGLFDEPGFRRHVIATLSEPLALRQAQRERRVEGRPRNADPLDEFAEVVKRSVDWRLLREKIPWLPL
jgi:adenosylcobyric acid synthase